MHPCSHALLPSCSLPRHVSRGSAARETHAGSQYMYTAHAYTIRIDIDSSYESAIFRVLGSSSPVYFLSLGSPQWALPFTNASWPCRRAQVSCLLRWARAAHGRGAGDKLATCELPANRPKTARHGHLESASADGSATPFRTGCSARVGSPKRAVEARATAWLLVCEVA